MSDRHPDAERRCPYKGLVPFSAEDEKYFFGRTGDADLIAANILSTRLLILHGPSGVGKSSVLEAALPRSLARILPDPLVITFRRWDRGFYGALLQYARQQGWAAYRRYGAYHRWSLDDDEQDEQEVPLEEPENPPLRVGSTSAPDSDGSQRANAPQPVARQLRRLRSAPPAAYRTSRVSAGGSKRNSLERLAELWTRGVGTPVVFILDQFEQYFIGQDFGSTSEDHEFEADLARTVKRRDSGVHVLISIREDALHELNRLRAHIPNILVRSLKLDYLDAEAGREAITGPLGVWSREHGADAGPTRASPDLVHELIRQVSRNGDGAHIETPYLQLALTRLWDDGRSQGALELSRDMLLRRGGASGIARSHFDNTMEALSAEERRLCARIFDRMVTPSGMKIALSAVDLARFAGEDANRVGDVLEKLTHGPSRIIHRVISPTNEELVLFEIFHDVLARPILDWVAAEQERVRKREELEKQRRQAEEERARQQAELEQQRRQAEQEHARQQREIRWQQQQIAREKQIKHRYRRLAIVVFCLFVLASLFAGLATYTYREAAQQKARILAVRANTAIDSGQHRLALLAALAALPERQSLWQWLTRPIVDEATQALARSLYRPIGRMLHGHGGRVSQVAFSPDGSSVATASEGGSVRLWDAETGSARKNDADREIDLRHKESVTFVSFSAGGQFVATIANDGWAYIWDAKTGREKAHWRADNESGNHAIAISPDAETIVTTSFNAREAKVWSWNAHVGDPQWRQELRGFTHENGITSASFDATGRRALTTSWNETARIWDVASGTLLLELPERSDDFDGHEGPVRSGAFSPDGTLVVTASVKKAHIWRTDSPFGAAICETNPKARGRCALFRTLQGHSEQVLSAAFDSSGKRVVTASLDGTVRIWDVSSGETLQILQGPKIVRGNTASVSTNGQALAAAFGDTWAYLWDIDAPAEPLPCMPGNVTSVAVSRDGQHIAASFDEAVRIFDIKKSVDSPANKPIAAKATDIGSSACMLKPDLDTTEQVMSIAFDGEGHRLATAAGDRVDLWEIGGQSYRKLGSFQGHRGLVLSVAFDQSSQRLVTASQDGTARVWDMASGAPPVVLGAVERKNAVFSAAFSNDGGRVATGSFKRTLRLWDAATGRELAQIDTGRPVLAVAFTSDDRYVLTTLLNDLMTLDDGTAKMPFRTSIAIWDAQTGKRVPEQDAILLRLADRLVTYTQDAGILFSKGMVRPPSNRDVIRNIFGSAGGAGVYTVSLDGKIRMWPLPPSEPYELIRYAREIVLAGLAPGLRSLSQEECRELGLSGGGPTEWIEARLRRLSQGVGEANPACASSDRL